ncbi:MAG TPA: hypothetical protein EYQ00_05390 [Dehalococcoidia bacterium]|jgi:hypothetical protein|nr:hypothetical protein [Dehalococcoidia bacterium]
MEVGDLVQIKSTAFYTADYHWLLLNERMLVVDIIDELLPTRHGKFRIPIDGVVECISESGVHRFPVEDMEVVDESR